jgi:hypothetical protein
MIVFIYPHYFVFFIASAVLHEEALCRSRDFVLVIAGYYSLPVFPSIKVQSSHESAIH